MNVEEIDLHTEAFKLASEDPAFAEQLTKILHGVVDFYKTRGKLLRSLQPTAPAPDGSPVQQ
jgi:hypothetical protein